MKTTSFHRLVTLFALGMGTALAGSACGDSGSGSGGSTSASTTSDTSSTTATSGTSSSTGSSMGGGGACTELTLAAFKKDSGNGSFALYFASSMPELGDMADLDQLNVGFFGSGIDAMYNGEATGSFDLSMGGDANYKTCSRCVVLHQDPGAVDKTFFPTAGTLVIEPTSDQMNGTISATLTDVDLIEVTIDNDDFTSTPVPGGACVHIATAAVSFATTAPPMDWKCPASYYGDMICDCGCGAQDIDCPDLAIASCVYCDDMGSCSMDACPGMINPTNNAVCG